MFNGTNRTTFTNNIIPIERNNYVCIAAIDIDSVLKIENKRAYLQAYLEQCKYTLKKRKIVNFIDDEIVDDEDEVIDDEISKENSYGSIRDKSSLATKGLLTLGGVIDNDYTGEFIVIMTSLIEPIKTKKGQKIAQLIVSNISYPEIKKIMFLKEIEINK